MRWRRRRKGYHRDQRGRASGNHGGGGTGGELCGSVYQAKWWQYRAGLPGNILLKSANVQKMGKADFRVPPLELPKGFEERFTVKDQKTGAIVPFARYRITTEKARYSKAGQMLRENGQRLYRIA